MTSGAETATGKGKRIRLTIDISPELRRRIKIAAAQRDLTVRAYVEDMLEKAVAAEPKTQPHPTVREWYAQLVAAREALARAYPGKVFDDSTEIIRQMREERSEELDRR